MAFSALISASLRLCGGIGFLSGSVFVGVGRTLGSLDAGLLFRESTAPSHDATLVCGRATPLGVELYNAGHCAPLLLQRDATHRLDSTGLPLGLFCGGQYAVRQLSLGAGESLVLYSDGITEAQDPSGDDYQDERLIRSLRDQFEQSDDAMADGVLRDAARFRQASPQSDDMTLLIVRRRP